MNRTRTAALLALTLLATAACTRRVQVESEPNQPSNNMQTSAAPAEVDMVGVYDYRVDAGGEVITGPMTVTRAADGAYTVRFVMDDGNEVPTRNVRRTGNSLTMDATTPGGEGTITLRWTTANAVEGEVFLGNIIPLTATRRS